MASFFCQWFSRDFRGSARAAARTPERFPGKTPRLLILLIVCLIACLTLCDRGDNPKHKRAPSETIVGAEEETEKTAPAPEENVETDEEHPNQEQPAKESTAQSQTAKTRRRAVRRVIVNQQANQAPAKLQAHPLLPAHPAAPLTSLKKRFGQWIRRLGQNRCQNMDMGIRFM